MSTLEHVQICLSQALGMPIDEIWEDTLLHELGADSLDFLDITFRLERRLGVSLQTTALFPEWLLETNSEYVHRGNLTSKGVQRLTKEHPQVPAREGMPAGDVLTVGFLVQVLDRLLVPSGAK
jgi:acyl carrier protein